MTIHSALDHGYSSPSYCRACGSAELNCCDGKGNKLPKLGSIQINATDYDGRIVVEQFGWANEDAPFWHVPAWDERGFPELEGPFGTIEEAQAAVDEFKAAMF